MKESDQVLADAFDHIVPLKRGGADDPSNMQWEGTAEAKVKDRME